MKAWKLVSVISFLFAGVAFAADEAVDVLPIDAFFNQVLVLVKTFGGIPWTLKVAGIIQILIALTKVSFFRPVWDMAGPYKAIVAPALGFFAGIFLMDASQISLAGLAAYTFAGAGAIVLHQMLDGIKGIPGIGAQYVAVVNFISKFLKAPTQ